LGDVPIRPLYRELAPFYEVLEERDYSSEVSLIASELERRGCRKVIDLGCGVGTHARMLAERGFEVTGIDLSPHMVRQARRASEGVTNVRFLVGDYYSYRPRRSFDAALCLNWSIPVVERDLARFLRNTWRMLKGGGLLIFDYEDPSDIVWSDLGEPQVDSWRFGDARLVRVSVASLRGCVMRSRDVYMVFGKPRGFKPPSERDRHLARWGREGVSVFLDISNVRFYETSHLRRVLARQGFQLETVHKIRTRRGYRRLYAVCVKGESAKHG
jgi:SAM-dependent methyltransferase